MFTRRTFLGMTGLGGFAFFGLGSYAFAVEPRFRLEVTPYRLAPPAWPAGGRPIRIAAIADVHACEPWMPLARIEEIVRITNTLEPDVVVLLGDYVAGLRRFRTSVVSTEDWSGAFAKLKAPLGVHAILGNHDWWTDVDSVRDALHARDIPVLENDAALITPDDAPAFWLAGLGDQIAYRLGEGRFRGVDDLPGTLARIPDDDTPVVLLAHEPDIFPKVPARVALTLAGHTHGGQVSLPFVGRPIVPSGFGDRYAYGHILEDGRNLIVSGGLGCSILPVRFGVPPEIVVVEVGGEA